MNSERGAPTDKDRGERETVERLVADIEDSCDGYSASSVARAALLAHFAQVLADVQHENRLRRAAESECLDAHVALRAAEAERDELRMQYTANTGQLQEEASEARDWRITAIHCRKQREALLADKARLREALEGLLECHPADIVEPKSPVWCAREALAATESQGK